MNDQLRLRDDALEWRAVEGEVIALDVEASQYLGINESGAAIWSELAGGTTRTQLVDRLEERYRLPREDAARDVDAFLTELRGKNLLVEE